MEGGFGRTARICVICHTKASLQLRCPLTLNHHVELDYFHFSPLRLCDHLSFPLVYFLCLVRHLPSFPIFHLPASIAVFYRGVIAKGCQQDCHCIGEVLELAQRIDDIGNSPSDEVEVDEKCTVTNARLKLLETPCLLVKEATTTSPSRIVFDLLIHTHTEAEIYCIGSRYGEVLLSLSLSHASGYVLGF